MFNSIAGVDSVAVVNGGLENDPWIYFYSNEKELDGFRDMEISGLDNQETEKDVLEKDELERRTGKWQTGSGQQGKGWALQD